ncbi:MAG: hypothetical protein B7Z78_00220 [Rhodospirillales bacterium 20-60-12]|nr:MAG: hypothetical protein B7Z78_00220 [Rhodospirillales bacterium 20-60-12]HQT66496.1 transcriptional repressor [Acetobacteraceae bacterium]HQU02632.1 transcriptional repressor [Acetobacteraceae bacterium]
MHKRTQAWLDERLAAAASDCAARQLRFTDLRRDILALILQVDRPVTAYQLLEQLQQTRAKAAPPTVYRALEFLLEQHLIHRIERLNAFIACAESGMHMHPVQFLICLRCKAVTEMDDHTISDVVRRAAEAHHFRAEFSTVEVEGLCADCVLARAP